MFPMSDCDENSCSTSSISVKCVINQCLCIISMNFIVFRWQWQNICGISDENGISCAIEHWHNMCYRNVRTMAVCDDC